MKKRILFYIVLCCISVVTYAKNFTKDYELPSFSSVALNGSTELIITYTEGESKTKAIGNQEEIKRLTLKVVDDKLMISEKSKNKSWWLDNSNGVKVYLEIANLNSLELIGSGDILVKDNLNWGADLKIALNGSGDININKINGTKVTLNSRGSGDIKVNTLTAPLFMLNTRGSGDTQINYLKVEKGNSTANGSGDLIINKAECYTFNGAVYGSGDLTIKEGNAEKAELKSYGSGDINAKNFIVEQLSTSTTGSGDIGCYAQKSFKKRVGGSGQVYNIGEAN